MPRGLGAWGEGMDIRSDEGTGSGRHRICKTPVTKASRPDILRRELPPSLRTGSAAPAFDMKVSLALLVASFGFAALSGAADFKTQILPIFESKCYRCHGNGESRGGLSLDVEEIEKHIRRNGAINPGNSSRSELFERVTVAEGNNRMPRNASPLSDDEVELIKAWIDAGAKLDGEAGTGDAPAPAAGAMTQQERVKEEWTNREGRTITATLLRVDGANAILLLENGTSTPYPIANFSDESQAKVRAFMESQ